MIDFAALRRKEQTFSQLAAGLTPHDLARATNAMCDLQLALIADAVDEDVVFVPDDPEADDTFADDQSVVKLAWTLGHVVVHTTASAEESAALALTMARGLPVDGRSRYEVPWEEARSADYLRHRIQESRRMRLAMLDAWPDEPHLDITYEPYKFTGPLNAIGRFVAGLMHDDSHVEQIRKIMVQCRAARGAGQPKEAAAR
jgi:DinB superfamily